MDMVSKDETEPEKRNEEAMNFESPNMSSDWQLSGSNLTNASKGMILNSNPMVNSFCSSIWDHPTSSSNLGYCGTNIQINPCTSNSLESAAIGLDPLRAGLDRMLGMGWAHPNAMLKGGMFITPTPGMLPQSLPHFPADSGFIERAARFSCFNGGNVGDMMNPLSISESLNPHYKGIKSLSAIDHQKQHIGNEADSSNNVTLPFEHGDTERSPLKNGRKSEIFARSQDEAIEAVGVSGNESDEAECSGQEEVRGESSAKGLGSKKRKRSGQDTELDQMQRAQRPPAEPTKDQTEIQKGEQNLNSPVSKPAAKNGKHGSQASDSPKEDYIHIRARRGQATNSHSLAERVRREKISERMKFLQDLVPGCNKVTGKAVMLDEIINYVQSLQRQVEFLSMKLATVNPRLDFNVDGLLAKDILHLRAGPSSSLAFPPDMTVPNYPSLHQPQPGLLQSGLPGLGNHTNALCRSTDTQLATIRGGYKDSSSQVPNVWHDELHNIVQMGLNSNVPLHSQDLSGGALPPGQMKAEP